MRVLLLNPPAPTRLQRAEISSTTTKSSYYECPVDLLTESGILASEHEILVVDAIVESLSDEEAFSRIAAFKPEAILCLTSVVSARGDLRFLRRCKQDFGCRIILTGDVCYIRPDLMIQAEEVDALCLQYPAPGLLSYLRGEADAPDLVVKTADGVRYGAFSKGPASYTMPKHTAFPLKKYSTPLMYHSPFVSVLTSLSCPMQCSYCSHSSTTYRQRPLEDILSELEHLKRSGIKEILFADLMFNSDVKRTKQLCAEMIRRELRFSWYCQMRPDKIDDELLDLMAEAGCHTVMYGVESSHGEILRSVQRPVSQDQMRRAFAACRERGMRTLAYMLLGLPGETRESAMASIDFMFELKPDYLSVNLFAPRIGSGFMRKYQTLDELLAPQPDLDSTLTETSHCSLTGEQLVELRRYAIRKFYLRPSLLLSHFLRFKTMYHLKDLIMSGFRLLVNS